MSGVNFKGERIGEDISRSCGDMWCSALVQCSDENCCGGIEGTEGVAGCGDYFCEHHMRYNRLYQFGRCEPCEREELV